MKHTMTLKTLLLLLPLAVLSACSMASGIATSLGAAASKEGGISSAAEDTHIQIAINDLWFRKNVDMFSKLDLTVHQGRVLITGIVQNPEHRVEAVRLAWQPKGVKQVINEIRVADSESFGAYAQDAWISAYLRTALTFDKNILSINYTIDTVESTVYLMGVAQSQLELNRVIEKARRIKGVKNVVSYVKIANGRSGAPAPRASKSSAEAVPVAPAAAPPAGSGDMGEMGGAPLPALENGATPKQGIESEVLN